MAERRMFAKTIIDSDLFLDMPSSTQNLYFHLAMRADDDGFVNSPQKIMRTVSCSRNDMDMLIFKQFVLPFDSGICVIKHWKIHNYLRSDRYKETLYTEEKRSLQLDNNNMYIMSDNFGIPYGLPTGIPNDIPVGDAGKVRLGKVRLGEGSKDKHIADSDECGDVFNRFWKLYPNKKGKTTALKKWRTLWKKGIDVEKVMSGTQSYIEFCTKTDRPFKDGSTFVNQEGWNDEWEMVGGSSSNVGRTGKAARHTTGSSRPRMQAMPANASGTPVTAEEYEEIMRLTRKLDSGI